MVNTTDGRLPTIVYVEDNSGDAVLLEEALRERGYAVELLIIATGEKALHYFEIKNTTRDVPPPHCVLLDMYLPTVNGAQLIAFIRASDAFKLIPVYLFASERECKKVAGLPTLSPNSFLTKPTTWAQFLILADLLMSSSSQVPDGESRELAPPPELRR
jgi:CheY-like chemotaxis protein